ncbi:esterase-like activity of phytase family protein [Granulosicoccus sp. 3-233]|uniref:esterase-like activity of phytase family protein n=1 Tax=Granulosicoccus sp. 3-233 TaxID=3417969 RepID=UPI003D337D16
MYRTATALSVLMATGSLHAADAVRHEATLEGHAILPARTLIAAPEDAPEALQISGKFTSRGNPVRSTEEPTQGESMPLIGQPLQGFSGIRTVGDGSYHVLTDNGFGSRSNSPDAMLFFHQVRPDFATGEVIVEKTTFLSDPNKVVPFVTTMEGSESRYLTGADLDIEGFQMVGDDIVIGDEFGPYIIVANAQTGIVSEFHETYVDGELVKSPDHHSIQLPNPGAELPAYTAKRSRGFEGFAASVDGKTLYPLLEGALWQADKNDWERLDDGRSALRILEMTAATREWTGNSWLYPLEDDSHAIGDFNMIDATRGLIIERDGGQGDAEMVCAENETEECFDNPAGFKRVYLIDMAGVEPGQPVNKVAYIDLLDIRDPDGVARQGQREDARFTFPFVTIENVDRVDETHIIVANDNNFPFSTGRTLGQPDDNEMILLEVGDFLRASVAN